MRTGEPRRIDQPEPGFFSYRLVKKGPKVAARIIHHDGRWSVEINGDRKGGAVVDPIDNKMIFRVWHSADRIDEAEYRYLLDRAAWARQYAPDDPYAHPDQPIRLDRTPPLF